jgi:two-component system response regulator NreC
VSHINVSISVNSVLIAEGIRKILAQHDEICVIDVDLKNQMDIPDNKTVFPHIVIVEIIHMDEEEINAIHKIVERYERIKVLTIGMQFNKDFIIKGIQAGAKGFITYNTTMDELTKAIYTLRNGYDYYSNSISHLLINDYIQNTGFLENQTNDPKKKLSNREMEILTLWGQSYTNQEIADKLFISIRTVESHKNHIMQKLNLKTNVDLFKYAVKNKIIQL